MRNTCFARALLLAIVLAIPACSEKKSSSGPDEPCYTAPEGCTAAWIAETCKCYGSIQEAVTRAESGQTVMIAAGTFTEPVTIDRQVRLMGMGAGQTVLRGVNDQTGNVVSVRGGNGVTISNMTVHHPDNGTALFAYATVQAALTVQSCEIIGELVDFSTGMLLQGCTIRAVGGRDSIAVYGYGFDTVIRGNDIQSDFIAYSFTGMGGRGHKLESNTMNGYGWTVELNAADGVDLLSNTVRETGGSYGSCVYLQGDARGDSLIAANAFARSGGGYDIACFIGSDQRQVRVEQPGAAIDPDCAFASAAATGEAGAAELEHWRALSLAKRQDMVRRNAAMPLPQAPAPASQRQAVSQAVR